MYIVSSTVCLSIWFGDIVLYVLSDYQYTNFESELLIV